MSALFRPVCGSSRSHLRRSAFALLPALLAASLLSACAASAANSTDAQKAAAGQLSAQFLFDAYTGNAQTCKLLTAQYLAEMKASDSRSGCKPAYSRLDGYLVFAFKWNGGTLGTLRKRVEAALAHATVHLSASEAVVTIPNEIRTFAADDTVLTLQRSGAGWKVAGLTESTGQQPTDRAVSGLEQQEYKAAKVAIDNVTRFDSGHRLVTDIARAEPELASVLSADVAPVRAQAKPGVIYLGSVTAREFIIVAYTTSGDRVELHLDNGQLAFKVIKS